jgi:hypothetical protein
MSGTTVPKRRREKFLDALPFRSSSRLPSPQPPVSQRLVTPSPSTAATNASGHSSAITASPAGQAVGGASSTKDVAFREKVLERLTEDQRSTLGLSYAQSSGDISSILDVALQAAEDKKALCSSK